MQETCIVIPLFNEEKRLDVEQFTKFIEKDSCKFYFVNDGSRDQTLRLLKEMESSFPEKVKVIDFRKNLGKAEAVRQGVLEALSSGDFLYVGYFDADLATPLEEINYLLGYLKAGRKSVIGSRVKRLGSNISRTPTRHYLGRVFATVASLYLNIKVYDSQCGAKLFQRKTAKVLFSEPFVSKWLFDLELIYRFKKLDPKNFHKDILEVPLRTWTEKKGSKLRARDLIKVPVELYQISKKIPEYRLWKW